MVFFMQAGFAMLEVGSVNKKNTRNILLKNVLDASLGAVFFGAVGWGLAYGDTAGEGFLYRFMGKDQFFLKKTDFGE
jgi:Amt family ammonium transporter